MKTGLNVPNCLLLRKLQLGMFLSLKNWSICYITDAVIRLVTEILSAIMRKKLVFIQSLSGISFLFHSVSPGGLITLSTTTLIDNLIIIITIIHHNGIYVYKNDLIIDIFRFLQSTECFVI